MMSSSRRNPQLALDFETARSALQQTAAAYWSASQSGQPVAVVARRFHAYSDALDAYSLVVSVLSVAELQQRFGST